MSQPPLPPPWSTPPSLWPPPTGQKRERGNVNSGNPAELKSARLGPVPETGHESDPESLPATIVAEDFDTADDGEIDPLYDDDGYEDFVTSLVSSPREPTMLHGWSEHLSSFHVCENLEPAPVEFKDRTTPRHIEGSASIGFSRELICMFSDEYAIIVPEHHDLVFVMEKDGKITAVIDKKYDELTKLEVQQHWSKVEIAIRKEVASFQALSTFDIISRKDAVNLMDSKFVLKWKEDSTTGERIVKARLTVRGFQDLAASSLETYASTASRWSQRFVVSICTTFSWTITVWDVSTAFLQGMSFDQLSTTTGTELRQVAFTPPRGAEKYFKELTGCGHYDPTVMVLRMLKPVYGLKDAPRAWRLRLDAELRRLQGHPMLSDSSVYLWFRNGTTLSAIISTHVDDLKGGGDKDTMMMIKEGIARAFGKLAEKVGTFIHCGVAHEQMPNGDIFLDQNQYVQQLHAADVAGLNKLELSAPLTGKHKSDFDSLLGGIAWVCQTRMDIAIYTCALQRKAKAPTTEHLFRLNRLVKWMRKYPVRIRYHKFADLKDMRLTVISDSAFRREGDEGLAMRGYIVAFGKQDDQNPGGPLHLLDWGSKKQKRVTRSTYSAELNSLIDCFELSKIICTAATEALQPALRPRDVIRLEAKGALALPIECTIDAKSVFDSLAQAEITPPTESALVYVLQVIKEALKSWTLRTLWWCDTHDMLSDGLNKGLISRRALNTASSTGMWELKNQAIPFRESTHSPIIRAEDHR